MECEEKNKDAEGKKRLGFKIIGRGFGPLDERRRPEPIENNCWWFDDRRDESFRIIRIILKNDEGRLAIAGW